MNRTFRKSIKLARHCRARIKFAYQRVTRGWDDSAIWSLDNHLCQTLGEQLVYLAKVGHGYPLLEAYPTSEAWDADLVKYGQALLLWANQWELDMDDVTAVYEKAQEALRWVADNLWHLWD